MCGKEERSGGALVRRDGEHGGRKKKVTVKGRRGKRHQEGEAFMQETEARSAIRGQYVGT